MTIYFIKHFLHFCESLFLPIEKGSYIGDGKLFRLDVFGVKLPVMLVGSMLFVRKGVKPFLLPAILAAAAGTLVMLLAEMFIVYLCGVALFAFGYANMYGFVYGVAAPRHPGVMPSVAALLTMSIAGGALASPLVHVLAPCGSRSTEALVLALTVALLGLFVSIRRRI